MKTKMFFKCNYFHQLLAGSDHDIIVAHVFVKHLDIELCIGTMFF
jgi:hypothetical protein